MVGQACKSGRESVKTGKLVKAVVSLSNRNNEFFDKIV